VERLVGAGASVRVVDDLSSGSLVNLASVHDRIEFRRGDLRERDVAMEACRDVAVVFHLAASHGGRGYIDTHPVECSTNMILDGIVFAAAHAAGVERVCFASSACVYPTTLQQDTERTILLREDMADPFAPGAALADGEYGWAKLMGEMTLRAYHRQHGMRSVACRIFTAYGERENETHAIIALIAKAYLRLDPYPIWGTGQQDRNFTYVGDIVEGLMRAVFAVDDGSPVNVGRSEHVKVIDAARTIFELTGFTPREIAFDTTKPTGVLSRAADLDRTRRLLGWEPSTSFREGLRRTVDWYVSTHPQIDLVGRLETLLVER
jgi:UDP-glucose 4-epimerase